LNCGRNIFVDHRSDVSALPGKIKTHEIDVKVNKNAKCHSWHYW